MAFSSISGIDINEVISPAGENRHIGIPWPTNGGFNNAYEGLSRTINSNGVGAGDIFRTNPSPSLVYYDNAPNDPYTYVQNIQTFKQNEIQMGSYSVSYVKELEAGKEEAEIKYMLLHSKVIDLLKAISRMKTMPEDFFGSPASVVIYMDLLVSSAIGGIK